MCEISVRVPHAIPGRDNTATDIHGMTGIPEIALYGIFVVVVVFIRI